MKQGLFIAGSMVALMAAMPAQAQEAAAVEAEGEVIVVTAQKRVEALQDVPISITVVNGEGLREQGAGSLVDYAGYVPGMTVISSQPGTSIISLRGIAPVGSAQAVGIYLDDAPVGSSSLYARSATYSLDLMPYDIAGLEILRGPQGTLYGASSIGGLLKYRTVAPSTTDFSVKAGGELFTIDEAGNPGWAAQVMVNAPIIQDKLGITGSFSWRKTPGYVSSVNNPALNDANDVEQRGGRVSLLWNVTEDFTVRLGGIWQTIDANATNAVISTAAGVPLGDGWSYNSFLPEPFRKSIDYYSAVLDYDLGFATLTSVSTYSETSTVSVQDASLVFGIAFPALTGGAVPAGLAPFSVALDLEKFTQEIRLASPSNDRFEWLIGAFYTKEESENHQLVRTFDFSGAPNALDPGAVVSLPSTFKEMAVFANATAYFGDMFALSGGVRYAKNKQNFQQISSGPFIGVANFTGKSDEDVFIYSVSPQFHISKDAMLYARVANGYRPGGPNVVFPGVPPQVKADTLVNYEVGFKGNLGRALSVELAGFYMDWTDIQVVQPFGGVTGQANGPSAVSKGVEGTMTWRPAPGLSLVASASYADAKLTADAPEISGVDGARLPSVPKFTGSVQADYSFAIGGDATGKVGVGVRHSSKLASLPSSSPDNLWSDAYTALDANAAVTFDDHWTVRVYARNLTNERASTQRSYTLDAFGTQAYQTNIPLQPRTIGVALDMAF
ncbi:TonB-dependent receptor [Sphingopyxis sp. C-1]|uniref:TonB-dependent receptor n=1 Tax=Sphingopyxis sp. C-1 TaxID=262667 RepID=UPI0007813B5F|nr:TonB-dependent receptor [Sphingopyxis sp. C-1]